MGIRCHTHPGAGRPVEHPSRNLEPTVRIRTAQTAAKNSAVRSLNRRVNADPKTAPRMSRVQQFSKLSSVGVLKLCFTIAAGRTRALTTAPRIKPTSTNYRSARRPNPGRGSTWQRGKSVQTTGAPSGVICRCRYSVSLADRKSRASRNKITKRLPQGRNTDHDSNTNQLDYVVMYASLASGGKRKNSAV
jgi:hypothetical protein